MLKEDLEWQQSRKGCDLAIDYLRGIAGRGGY
jgi:hypothetical protein